MSQTKSYEIALLIMLQKWTSDGGGGKGRQWNTGIQEWPQNAS